MKAIFKDKNKVIISSADNTEQLLVDAFIENAKSDKFKTEYSVVVDINGDTAGMAIELKEVEEPTEEPEEAPQV